VVAAAAEKADEAPEAEAAGAETADVAPAPEGAAGGDCPAVVERAGDSPVAGDSPAARADEPRPAGSGMFDCLAFYDSPLCETYFFAFC
jgi:hypothetical protein